MILAILIQPIKTIFAPLFWVLDETIPKDEKPTLENFKKCYINKCNKNQPPGDVEKRLLLELLGSIGVISGAMLWVYGYFKNSKFWKYLGGGLSFGGLGTTITGLIQYARLGIGELLKLPKKSDPIEPDEKNKANDNPEPVPKNMSLVPVNNEVDNGDSTKTKDQNGQKDVIQDELAEPGYGKQLLNIGEGAVNKVAATTSDILESHPNLKPFILIIPGGGSILLAVEAVKIFNEFRKGNFSFEYADPKTGQKTEYSYSDDKTKNKILFEKSCEILGVNENSTEEEVKKAYRSAAKKYHPDRNLGDETAVGQFKNSALAYEIIRKYRGWD